MPDCAYHPGYNSVARCKTCGKEVCERCVLMSAGVATCRHCKAASQPKKKPGEQTEHGGKRDKALDARDKRRKSLYRKAAFQRKLAMALITVPTTLAVLAIVGAVAYPYVMIRGAEHFLKEENRGHAWAPKVTFRAGNVCFKLGWHQRAIAILLPAVEAFSEDPQTPEAYFLIALAYEKTEDRERYVEWLVNTIRRYRHSEDAAAKAAAAKAIERFKVAKSQRDAQDSAAVLGE